MKPITAELLLLLVTALWGATFAIIKSLVADVPPMLFICLRFAIATVVAIMLWPKSFKGWDKTFAIRSLLLGTLYAAGFMLQAQGLLTTTATSSAFITSSAVVFVPFVFRFVERVSIRPLHIISVCCVVVGLYVFTSPSVSGFNVGDALTLGSALVWAVYITYIDVWTKDLGHRTQLLNALVVAQFGVTFILSVIVLPLAVSDVSAISISTNAWLGILYCAIAATVVATWIQTRFQRFTHPVRAGIIFTAEPVFGAIVAWLALSETLSNIQWIGASIMMGAIVIPDLIMKIREPENPKIRKRNDEN